MTRVAGRELALAVWLSLLALVVRVIVPSGFMLVPGDGGEALPRLVLCSSEAQAASVADAGEHAGQQHHDRGNSERESSLLCAFAGASPTFTLALTPVVVPAFLWVWFADGLLPSDVTHQGEPVLPPPSTGPPHRS